MTSDASRPATASRAAATALGRGLADLADTPDALLASLRAAGGDPTISAASFRAIAAGLRAELETGSSATALSLAQRLAAEPALDARLLAVAALHATIAPDPERTWQVVRRLGRGATEPVLGDALAVLMARGVLAEGFRWAELEQLVYSDRAHERRLVGAAVAAIPGLLPASIRPTLRVAPALGLLADLMGDADSAVRAALARAIRALARVDAPATAAWCAAQADAAAAALDGNRAAVLREALPALPAAHAAAIHDRLAGIRRRPGAPSTSHATEIARRFGLAALADLAVGTQGDRYLGSSRA